LLLTLLNGFPSLLSKCLASVPINWASAAMEQVHTDSPVDTDVQTIGAITLVLHLLEYVDLDMELSETLREKLCVTDRSSKVEIDEQIQSFLPAGASI
jgi:hypothetical protein